MIILRLIYKLDFTTETQDNGNDNGNENVTITIAKFRNKQQTTIEGLNLEKIQEESHKAVLKKLKKLLSCNGHIDAENTYVFQGDHRVAIKTYLISSGINKDLIIESGTGK